MTRIYSHDTEKAQPAEDTQNKAGSLLSKFGDPLKDFVGETPVELLSQIFVMMMLKRDKDKAELDRLEKEDKDLQDSLDTRNEELIRALTGKKKPPTKRELAQKKKEEVKEKKQAKREEKEEAKRAKKEPTKVPKETKPPVTKEVPSGPRPSIPTAVKAAAGAAVVGGLLMPSAAVASVIDKASSEVGVDRSLMYAMAKQESSFNPAAAATTSSAKGLYQFIKGTWKTMVEKYGSKFPILREKGPDDPEANAIAGALFIKENSDVLSKAKIPVNATTIYAAHFLGAGGAKVLLTADPNKDAVELLPGPAKANAPIFLDKNKQHRTVQQVVDVLFEKVGKYQDMYAQRLGASSVPAPVKPVEQLSKENKDLKKSIENDNSAQNTINNTNLQSQQTNVQKKPQQQVDDRPAIIGKTQNG